MKKLLYRAYLKRKISLLKGILVIKNTYRYVLGFLYSIKNFAATSYINFKGLNTSFKAVIIVASCLLFFGSGLMLKNSYSQDFNNTQTYSTYGSTQSSIPPTAVQDEVTQFLKLGVGMIGGTTDSQGNQSAGMLDVVSNLDAYVYQNNPVSFKEYAGYYAQSHALVPGANAQNVTGSGYVALSPIIPLWEIFRNVAYLVIAVMIVVIGFIIIFGGKYGQNEVTIVSSIPKIVLALIVITFSYPIAGLTIDISNLGTNIVVNLLGPQFVKPGVFIPGQYPVQCNITETAKDLNTGSTNQQNVQQCAFSKTSANTTGGDFNVFRLMAPIVNYGQWSGANRGKETISKLIDTPTNIGFLDGLLQGLQFLSGTTEFAIDFIVEVLILFWAIKIFILVLTSFVRIVITAMFGPLMLVSYPLGGGGVFLKWFKNLLGPALVFPAVFAMMFIAAILAYGTDCSGSTPCSVTGDFNDGPWYIKNGITTNFESGPLLFVDTINPQYIWNFVALGIIIAIPSIAKQIDEALGNEVSRHIEQQGQAAGQTATRVARSLPLVGGIIGRVL